MKPSRSSKYTLKKTKIKHGKGKGRTVKRWMKKGKKK